MKNKADVYIDVDGVIFNTTATIVKLYNEDFSSYSDFIEVSPKDILTWEFKELSLATKAHIDHYFNTPRFFSEVIFMKNAIEILKELCKAHNVKICTCGYSPNLRNKEKFFAELLAGYDYEFIGINFKQHLDKSHIDMSKAIFIDDSMNNLATSNAYVKICFGETLNHNEAWQGIRVKNWLELKERLC